MTILRVWQECSRNLLWIILALVQASPNNSLIVEFGVRGGGGALSLALSLLLVAIRWDGDEAALGCLTANPLHRIILQGWEFLFLSLSARSFASITRSQNINNLLKLNYIADLYSEWTPTCVSTHSRLHRVYGAHTGRPHRTLQTFKTNHFQG